MKTIQDLLMELKRDEVTEVALVSAHLPCVKVHGRFVPIDQVAPSSFEIRAWLCELAGLQYIDSLDAHPTQWQTHVDGLGRVAVVASATGEVLQVRVARVRGRATIPPRRSLRPPKTMPEGPGSGANFRAVSPAAPTIEVSAPAIVSTSAPTALSKDLARLLLAAQRKQASDVHVVAGRPVRLRLAGELVAQGDVIDEAAAANMLLPLVPTRLRAILERDGSVDFALDDAQCGRSRVNISRQRTGFKGAFRLIPRDVPTLASLGLPPEIGGATGHHQGLIVVTGPTGHGKTTTLAALVAQINEGTSHHVITVEDPVEFVHPRRKAVISQREVGTHTASFATALKASLREDPDVIVVGELRDTETVRMALAASETGHLVLGTMNTPSAAKTIDRLIDLFPPGDQAQVRTTLAGGLRLVVSQRLLPNADRTGLVAAAEVLPGSVALWNMIRDNKTYQIPSLQQRGRAAGIVRLDDSLADLVRSGRTTLDAAQPFALEVEEFLKKVRAAAAPPATPATPPAPQPAAPKRDLLARAGALWGKKD